MRCQSLSKFDSVDDFGVQQGRCFAKRDVLHSRFYCTSNRFDTNFPDRFEESRRTEPITNRSHWST